MNISAIRFDRAALVDAGWDINDTADAHGYRAIQAKIEHPEPPVTAGSAYAVMNLHECGDALEMRCAHPNSETDLNRIFQFLKLTNTPYTTH